MRVLEALVALLLGALAPASAAQVATSPVEVPTGVEAWYHITPAPQDGLPALNPYEAETLHVGAAAGVEHSRVYLTLQLHDLPSGSTVTGGTLTLPVHTGGSVAAEAARMHVCAAGVPTRSEHGSLEPPPPIDCSTSAPARYEPGDPPSFVADLGGFADLRTTGLAIVATADPEPWHVALYAKRHPADRPITASVTFSVPTVEPGLGPADMPIAPAPAFPPAEPVAPAPPGLIEPMLPGPAAPPLVPPPGDGLGITPVADDIVDHDLTAAYLSWILLVPLALLAFVAYFSRVLLADDDRQA